MGSQKARTFGIGAENCSMVSMKTAALKDRLNNLYGTLKQSQGRKAEAGLFDYLWDLKEQALKEGKSLVDVPETWLDELEDLLGAAKSKSSGH